MSRGRADCEGTDIQQMGDKCKEKLKRKGEFPSPFLGAVLEPKQRAARTDAGLAGAARGVRQDEHSQ